MIQRAIWLYCVSCLIFEFRILSYCIGGSLCSVEALQSSSGSRFSGTLLCPVVLMEDSSEMDML